MEQVVDGFAVSTSAAFPFKARFRATGERIIVLASVASPEMMLVVTRDGAMWWDAGPVVFLGFVKGDDDAWAWLLEG